MMTTAFPRDDATVADLHRLADEYRQAALTLSLANGAGRPGAPLLLIALHAVELYLDAFLLLHGHTPAQLREMKHDLNKRLNLAAKVGFKLKATVHRSLGILCRTHSYVRSRYDSACVVPDWQRNRVDAILKEFAETVATRLVQPASSNQAAA